MFCIALAHLKTSVKKFRDDSRGTVSVEAVIIFPILFWAFIATIMFFDLHKSKSGADKAAFTISDMLSRETAAINQTYVENAHLLFNAMSNSETETSLRVSVITYSERRDTHQLDWSSTSGAVDPLRRSDLVNIVPNIPELLSGERLILVETFSQYQAPVNVGLGTIDLDTFVFTRPRFSPLLAWTNT